MTLPHPTVAWVSEFSGWGLAAGEDRLRDGGDSNLAWDAVVSQEDAAPFAPASTLQIQIYMFSFLLFLPSFL